MADPFSPSGSDANLWQNLMQFGMATMAAANERDGGGFLKYGGGALGPIGAGGMQATQSARERALANAQVSNLTSETQSRQLQNAVSLYPINLQRQAYGMAPFEMPGIPQLQPIPLGGQVSTGGQMVGQQASGPQTPAPMSTGPSWSPNLGMSKTQPQTVSYPTGDSGSTGGVPSSAQQGAPSGSAPQNMETILQVAAGLRQPSSPAEAYQAAGWAERMGNGPLAKSLTDYAMSGKVAAEQEWAKVGPQLFMERNKPYNLSGPGAVRVNPGDDSTTQLPREIEEVIPGGRRQKRFMPQEIIKSGASNEQQSSQTPLGVRQNNPGNIRDQSGQGYRSYPDAHAGIQGTAQNLLAYNDKHGINTVGGIITRWAPPNENDTESYIQHVEQMLGVKRDQPLNVRDPQVLNALTNAIITHENGGNPYDPQMVSAGVQGALQAQPMARRQTFAPQQRQASFMPPQGGMPQPGAMNPQQAPQLPPVPAQPPNMQGQMQAAPGGYMTELGPGEKAVIEGLGKEYAGDEKKAYASAQASLMSLDQMEHAMDEMNAKGGWSTTGAAIETRMGIAKNFNSWQQALGMEPSFDAGKVGEWESFNKETKRAGMQVLNQMFGGGREAASIITGSISAVPSAENTPMGGKLVLNGIREAMHREIDLRNFKTNYLTKNSGNLIGADEQFNQLYPPAAYSRRAISQVQPIKVKDEVELKRLLPGTRWQPPKGPPRLIPGETGVNFTGGGGG